MSKVLFKAGTFQLPCGALVYVHTVGDKTSAVQLLPDQTATDRWPQSLREAGDKKVIVPNDAPATVVDLTTLSTANREFLALVPEPPDAEDKPRGRQPKPATGEPTSSEPRAKREKVAVEVRYTVVASPVDPTKKAGIPRAIWLIVTELQSATPQEVADKLPAHPMFEGSNQEPLRAAAWWLREFAKKGALTV